jgi:hypothetical protein
VAHTKPMVIGGATAPEFRSPVLLLAFQGIRGCDATPGHTISSAEHMTVKNSHRHRLEGSVTSGPGLPGNRWRVRAATVPPAADQHRQEK